MKTPELITFILYFSGLLGIGIFFYKKASQASDYLIGGKNMGKWVTALSAQASDMSGWLLMGLPGAMYLGGFRDIWMALGLLIGTILNWVYVAPRLRIYTDVTNTMTLPSFLDKRFNDPTKLIRLIASLVIIFFFTIYTSSGLVAIGKLFESVFSVHYSYALFVATGVILVYTLLGGYLAICWTDFFQGGLMFFAIIITPILTLIDLKGFDAVRLSMMAKEMSFSLISKESSFWENGIYIFSLISWGFGYFGQPHILTRFMSIRSEKEVKHAGYIAISWVVISLAGSVVIGLLGIALFSNLEGNESEKVFIHTVRLLFNPWVSGILLSAVLSAIMSTIDSQLIVASSSITEDAYGFFLHRSPSEKEKLVIGRLSVLAIALCALFFAWDPDNKILDLVAYAWGGLGASFGPAVLAALFLPNVNYKSIISGMVVGTAVLIYWKASGLGDSLYELFPGFVANLAVIFLTLKVFKNKSGDGKVENPYQEAYDQKLRELLTTSSSK